MYTIHIPDFGGLVDVGEFDSPESAAEALLAEGWKKNPIDPLYDHWKQWTFSLGNFSAYISEFNRPLSVERLKTIGKKTPR